MSEGNILSQTTIEHYKQQRGEPDRRRYENRSLMYSALVGVGVIAVVQLLTGRNLEPALQFSVYAYSIAIPLSAFQIFVLREGLRYKFDVLIRGERIVTRTALITNALGILFLFFSFDLLAGFLFLLFGVIGAVHYVLWSDVVEQIQDDDTPEESTPEGAPDLEPPSPGQDGTGG